MQAAASISDHAKMLVLKNNELEPQGREGGHGERRQGGRGQPSASEVGAPPMRIEKTCNAIFPTC